MNNKVIKELQKLLALCMEINEKTQHLVNFEKCATTKPNFSIYVYENGSNQIVIAMVNRITLPNINKCRQKLLKYKEW